jgi:hypothetical protein
MLLSSCGTNFFKKLPKLLCMKPIFKKNQIITSLTVKQIHHNFFPELVTFSEKGVKE